jgi:hypothetical protein
MKRKTLIIGLVVFALLLIVVGTVAASSVFAKYYTHVGDITTWGGASSIADAIAFPDDGKFIQLTP